MLSDSQHNRYHRHLILKDFGLTAQEKLLAAKVLVIGAGALGCPALQYLAAAGIGCIGIVDFDTIELSNLQRQILYSVDDVGKSKTETAAKKLNTLNPEIQIQGMNIQLNKKNAATIIQDFDLVIDGTDNFASRYLINDVCRFLNKPLIFGAVLQYEGQVAVFNLEDKETTVKINYRDVFPLEKLNSVSVSCSEVGVLGVLPGMIGVLQATEAIKIITGIGKPLTNRMLTYQALKSEFYEIQISPSKRAYTNSPNSLEEVLDFDYEFVCQSSDSSNEIDVDKFEHYRKDKDTTVIDVRELGELPLVFKFDFSQLPLSTLEQKYKSLSEKKRLLVFCNSGQRSLQAVSLLKKKFPEKEILSLRGGIIAWKNKLEKLMK